MTLDFDPDQVRGFSNDVMDELNEVIRPWIARVRELMADGDGAENYHVLGRSSAGGPNEVGPTDYNGRTLGFALASNISDGMRFLEQLETGLEGLSLASAVFVERLLDGDELNAEEFGEVMKKPKSVMGGQGDRYAN